MAHKISIIDAAHQGRVEDVCVLMKGHTKEQKSTALRWTAVGGHVEYVKAFLIPVSDPKASDSVALVAATKNRHSECVRLLIGVAQPKSDNSRALQWACLNNDQACFDLLYPLSDPIAALKNLAKDLNRPAQNMRLLTECIEREQQRSRLDHSVGKNVKPNTII